MTHRSEHSLLVGSLAILLPRGTKNKGRDVPALSIKLQNNKKIWLCLFLTMSEKDQTVTPKL